MAKQFDALDETLSAFIERQHMFFVGTAAPQGRVNLSPKGMDSLRILDPQRVLWLNLTGSGNESAAHLLEDSRMTIMFCSFDRQPLILRLYGQARVIHPRDADWSSLIGHFDNYTGARQLFELSVELVQTSCGYAVPEYTLERERQTLTKWADKKGEEGIAAYWRDQNQRSLDDKDTGIFS